MSDAARTFPCPGCGADLTFVAGGTLSCPYCGRREPIPATETEIEEHSFDDYLETRPDQMTRLEHQGLEVTCQSCGAPVSFEPPLVAGACDFCGVDIVAQAKAADPVVAPAAVLPFAVRSAAAEEAVRSWRRGLWFAPGRLATRAQDRGLSGIYLPFWTFDALTLSSYRGARGEYYWVEVPAVERRPDGREVRTVRRERRTRWHPARGRVERWFDDILIPASASLPAHRLRALEPWDLGEIRTYEPEYLAGYKAHRYALEPRAGFEQARLRMAPAIRADVVRAIGGDTQQVERVDTTCSAITFKHILLPIWLTTYWFHGKSFQVLVNARTGEVIGDRPWSAWKITGFTLMIVLAIGLIVTLSSR